MNYKNKFPFFKNNPNLVFLDSAASSQKHEDVINTVNNFYLNDYSNIHRGIYEKSQISTELFEETRKKVSKLINAKSEKEILFTSGATESLNIIANSLKNILSKEDNIILTPIEHHANLVPYLNSQKDLGFKIKYLKFNSEKFDFDYDSLENLIDNKTKILAITLCSNVTGTITDIEKIIKIIRNKKKDILIICDGTALISHKKIDVSKLDIDFLVFSSHKIYGPSGVGILWGKKENLELLNPIRFGGNMIDEVFLDKFSLTTLPNRFEGGTPNIEGVIGFGKAIDFILDVGYNNIENHEEELIYYFIEELNKLNLSNDIKILGITDKKEIKRRVGIFSFIYKGIHSHDIGEIFNQNKIAIRVGHHCAMPLHNQIYDISSSSRISFGIYNDKTDIKKVMSVLKRLKDIYKKGDFLLS
jgi:cysteine desulfurase/selenocysteine lyase